MTSPLSGHVVNSWRFAQVGGMRVTYTRLANLKFTKNQFLLKFIAFNVGFKQDALKGQGNMHTCKFEYNVVSFPGCQYQLVLD